MTTPEPKPPEPGDPPPPREHEHSPAWRGMRWEAEKRMILKGVEFLATAGDFESKSTQERFVLLKNKVALDALHDVLKDERPKTILDVGIFQGGSMVLFDLLFEPNILVGIDFESEVKALTNYIERRNAARRIRTYYECDQGNRETILQIVGDNFANGIDLVIDDASHEYERSRTTFECTFGALRTGGWYIIEDWGWNHWRGPWQEKEIIGGLPLSRLVAQLVIAHATMQGTPDEEPLIDKIVVVNHLAAFRRGPQPWAMGRSLDVPALSKSRLPVITGT